MLARAEAVASRFRIEQASLPVGLSRRRSRRYPRPARGAGRWRSCGAPTRMTVSQRRTRSTLSTMATSRPGPQSITSRWPSTLKMWSLPAPADTPGNDLIIDTKGTATIRTGTGRNKVKVTGHKGRDQLLCAPGSVDRIFADRGDYIAPSCRRAPGSQVVYHRSTSTAADSAQLARNLNGCTNNPHVDCSFLAASGSLPDFWWSQKTPEAQCPPSHQYLQLLDTVPIGSNFPFGVGMSNLGNIGFFAPRFVRSDNYVIGARVGSVTNWTFSRQPWAMSLHCTSDKAKGWQH